MIGKLLIKHDMQKVNLFLIGSGKSNEIGIIIMEFIKANLNSGHSSFNFRIFQIC